MGQHCELMAQTWNIPREEQDQLALESHQKLAASYSRRLAQRPDDAVSRPDPRQQPAPGPDPGKTRHAQAGLRKSPKGTLTAGNSTPLTDGASLVLLGSEEWAKERGLPILAYLRDGEAAAVDFVNGAEGC
jgi:acetyl-CoA C-acetyltransferase